MKSKLAKRNPATVVLIITAALTVATSGFAQAVYGHAPTSAAVPASQSIIDPVTGLPVPPPPAAPWKDPEWKDPDKTLADVAYDNVSIREVASHLRGEFKNAFDVLIPNYWRDPNWPGEPLEPGGETVKMQLKNVTASEVFNAMNLVFETENTPLRWELKLNGKRPTAILRVTLAQMPFQLPPPEAPKRMIYFVGDLVSDEKSGGMSIKQLVKTVSDVYQMSYGGHGGIIQFHAETQLLIINGTVDQIQFIQQTLSALREKVKLERKPQPKATEPKANADESKSP